MALFMEILNDPGYFLLILIGHVLPHPQLDDLGEFIFPCNDFLGFIKYFFVRNKTAHITRIEAIIF